MEKLLLIFNSILLAIPGFSQQRTTLIKTDSSVIKIFCLDNKYKSSEERFTTKKLKHIIRYYEDTSTIEDDYFLGPVNRYVGIQKRYNKKGSLVMTIDHDNGTWNVVDTNQYPFDKQLKQMKMKGDSIIRSFYGDSFFDKFIRWDMYWSRYFPGKNPDFDFTVSWTRDDSWRYEPTEGCLIYNIIKDNEPLGSIQLLIDLNGRILPRHAANVLANRNHPYIFNEGLENFSDKTCLDFKMTKAQALVFAEQLGLNKSDSVYTSVDFRWEKIKGSESEIHNGHFRIYVIQTNKSEYKVDYDFGYYAGSYDIWVFDPWTGEFIERKKISEKDF